MDINKITECNNCIKKDIKIIRAHLKKKQLEISHMSNKLDDLCKINNAINLYIKNETNRHFKEESSTTGEKQLYSSYIKKQY